MILGGPNKIPGPRKIPDTKMSFVTHHSNNKAHQGTRTCLAVYAQSAEIQDKEIPQDLLQILEIACEDLQQTQDTQRTLKEICKVLRVNLGTKTPKSKTLDTKIQGIKNQRLKTQGHKTRGIKNQRLKIQGIKKQGFKTLGIRKTQGTRM